TPELFRIAGTPSDSADTRTVTVRVQDTGGGQIDRNLTIEIRDPIVPLAAHAVHGQLGDGGQVPNPPVGCLKFATTFTLTNPTSQPITLRLEAWNGNSLTPGAPAPMFQTGQPHRSQERTIQPQQSITITTDAPSPNTVTGWIRAH